ncbi:MAG: 6-phosphogluconolactonase [Pseudomonadales bacterium]|nr:6-phosphogluconolactonase [Pseudomonadales bacterium]
MMTQALHEFINSDLLNERLATEVAALLEAAIAARGFANLAVSGGKTPRNLYRILAKKNLAWSQVNLLLVDERWVANDSADSNEHMLRECLLQDAARAAHYISIRPGQELSAASLRDIENTLMNAQALPFDVLLLGMGDDGHIASLFPCADEIYPAMAADNPALLMKISPQTVPYDRISFTLKVLLQSRKTFLLLLGAGKRQILKQALAGDNIMQMPVRALLGARDLDLDIYWAPR